MRLQLDPQGQRCSVLLLLVCLALCSFSSRAAWVPGGCGRRGPARRLQQAPADPSTNTSAPVIEMVEVDVVSQECVMISNAYYEVLPAEGVEEVVSPWSNLQDTAIDCCASCHDMLHCNAFQWCPLPEGCSASPTGPLFPYQGCQLIDLSRFLRGSVNTGQLKQQGSGVPFVAGSPLFFSVPKLTGYDVEIGRNFGGKFNYSCPSSLVHDACVLLGSAQELKGACDVDNQCLAFSYYPSGSDSFIDKSFGVLKGGRDVQLSSTDTELNPNAAIYIKLQGSLDSGLALSSDGESNGGDGSGGSTTVIAAVVGSVGGAALVAATVLLVLYLRQRRLKAAVSDDRKVAEGLGGTDGGFVDGEPDGDEFAPAGSGSMHDHEHDHDTSGNGSPLGMGGSGGSGGGVLELGSSDASQEDAQLFTDADAAAWMQHKSMRRTISPPSVVDASLPAGGRGGADGPPYSPFMYVSPAQLGAPPQNVVVSAAGGAAQPTMASVHASRSSSAASSSQGGAAAGRQVEMAQQQQGWHNLHMQQQNYTQQQRQQQQHYHTQQQQQQQRDVMPVVVEVQRAVPLGAMVELVGNGSGAGSGSGGTRGGTGERGSLPPSIQMAGNARELLEVFARMYNQRPAVDYAVVAEMLDQDTDPGAVAAAESADEERLRQVDAAAAQHRSATLSASRSTLLALDGSSSSYSQGSWLQEQQGQQVVVVEVAGGTAQNSSPPAAAASWGTAGSGAEQQLGAVGSTGLEPEQSLLPGMTSPPISMLPAATQWSLQPEEVEICKRPDGSYWQLGTGAFGTCYKGLYHGQQLVAVKVLHRLEERRRNEEFEREVALLKDLRDRNIVQFIGACLDSPAPMLVTEFMEFGDLWRALPLKNPAGQRIFAWHKRGGRVLYDVAKGLDYLHRRRIVHLDLKSANILLSRHGTAKICDIGMARVLGNKEYLSMLSGMGTFAWSAPEVLSGRRCTEKVDLYSFGVVIWEVCTGDVPVRGEMRPLVAPADCPQPVVDLYERCIAEQPEARPTATELLAVLEALL